MKGRIRLIFTADSETRDDRDGGHGWQRIRPWIRRAIEIAAEEMWKGGKTMGKTKEMWDN